MRKKLLIFCGITVLALMITTLVSFHRFNSFMTTPVTPPAPVEITIAPGTNFQKVAILLHRKKIIADIFLLKLLAHKEKSTTRIKAGDYFFSEPATPGQILKRLVDGDILLRKLTIPEGLTVREIARKLEKEKLAKEKNVLDLAFNSDVAKQLGIKASSLEGYLFPETYSFPKKTSAKEFLKMMVFQFKAKVTEDLLEKTTKQGLTLHQLVTLASIIQKESGNQEEMPLISAVFHNRLKKGIALQADPTVIYGIQNFDGNLTRKHLETSTPYNTYMERGLPPGPIANPGLEALRAAASPASVKYFYFVARGDGTHEFSTTLREHNRAVLKYQKRKK